MEKKNVCMKIEKRKEKSHYSMVIQIIFVVTLMFIWEFISYSHLFGESSELVFPSLEAIIRAFINNFLYGFAGKSLFVYAGNSLRFLLIGLLTGVGLSFFLSGICMVSNVFHDIYNLLVSVFDLLPGVALLPIVIIVVGIRTEVIIFLVVHSVLWPMSRSVLDGFLAVPRIYLEVGKNLGLSGGTLLLEVYLPASMSYMISGLKVGWARAWRGLISAEMIFGIASAPGIGLYINQMRTNMNNAEMYATLLVIILIGVFVQYGVLSPIEKMTIKKWGMLR